MTGGISMKVSGKMCLPQQTFTCSKSTIESVERCERRRSRVFMVNFGHISHLFLVLLLLSLNK